MHFNQRSCIKYPPRTQGIIEFHNKSVKHITLNSKRDRIDKIIDNIFVAKNSKGKQYEIALSRKRASSNKNDQKIKDCLPKKISVDNWMARGKKKQHAGPGHFQKNLYKKNCSKKLEHWHRVAIIPWGGQYSIPSGQIIEVINSCTVDAFLQILYMFYEFHIHEMQKLFENNHFIVKMVGEVVQLLLKEAFTEAKVYWLTEICSFTPDISKKILDSFGTHKQVTLYYIRHMFKRTYQYLYSSDKCPSKSFNDNPPSDNVTDLTLQEPTSSSNSDDSILESSIMEWESGTSKSTLFSCKERFQHQPEHTEYISEADHGECVVRCSGWRNVTNIEFIDSPPFLLFDIASSFRENINSLDALPLQISVYGETYRLGGVTSFVSSRKHYVGYIVEKEGFLFYDGLPTDNPVLHKYSKSRIRGDISLLCYLPLDDVNYVQIPSDDGFE